MAGLNKQSKSKGARRSVDMSASEEPEAAAEWTRPEPATCEEVTYRTVPPGVEPSAERFVIRLLQVAGTGALVEFALVYLTFHRGAWVEVAEIDSCHDDDVHLHQSGRQSRGRVSDPVSLAPIRTMDDVQLAYDIGLTRLEVGWRELKDRWHHA